MVPQHQVVQKMSDGFFGCLGCYVGRKVAPFKDPGVRPNIIRQGSVFCLTKKPKNCISLLNANISEKVILKLSRKSYP